MGAQAVVNFSAGPCVGVGNSLIRLVECCRELNGTISDQPWKARGQFGAVLMVIPLYQEMPRSAVNGRSNNGTGVTALRGLVAVTNPSAGRLFV